MEKVQNLENNKVVRAKKEEKDLKNALNKDDEYIEETSENDDLKQGNENQSDKIEEENKEEAEPDVKEEKEEKETEALKQEDKKDEKLDNKKSEEMVGEEEKDKGLGSDLPDDEMLEMNRNDFVGFFDRCLSDNTFLFDYNDNGKAKGLSNDKLAAEVSSFVFSRLAGTGLGIAFISTGVLSWLGVIIMIYANTPKCVKDGFKKKLNDNPILKLFYDDYTKIPHISDYFFVDHVNEIDAEKTRRMELQKRVMKEVKKIEKEKLKEEKKLSEKDAEKAKAKFDKEAPKMMTDLVDKLDKENQIPDKDDQIQNNTFKDIQSINEQSKNDQNIASKIINNKRYKDICKKLEENKEELDEEEVEFLKKKDLAVFEEKDDKKLDIDATKKKIGKVIKKENDGVCKQ